MTAIDSYIYSMIKKIIIICFCTALCLSAQNKDASITEKANDAFDKKMESLEERYQEKKDALDSSYRKSTIELLRQNIDTS